MENCYFVIEILSRLPVKTLARFKCVCKSWYDLIRSPFFIQKHLLLFGKSTTNGKYKDNGLFLFLCDYYNTKKIEANIIQVSSVDDNNVCANLDIRPFFPRDCSLPLLVGSCNGIVCLTEIAYLDFYKVGKAILWNPATRELKTLPTSDHITGLYTEWGYRRGSLGFGFDAKSNDYKVVRIASCRAKDVVASISPLAAVYSLATNSWKAIDCQAICMCFEKKCTINLNGICYWVARDVKWRLMILSFDMADEVFRKIPLPDLDCDVKNDDDKFKISCNLMELRGLLALVLNARYKHPDFYDVWLIDKNGKNSTSSWVRHLKIELQVFVKEPLGFWLDGEEFLFDGGERGVLSYDIKSQVITRDFHTNYEIPTSPIYHKRCVLYTESLVSLNTGTN